jgi:PAS domain S-box-containing protein
MNNRQFTDKENQKKLFKAFNKVYTTGESAKEFNWQVIRKDRTKRFIEVSVSLQKNSSGQPIGFQGIARDITERKQMEETLFLIKKAVESSSDAIGIADAQGHHFYQNKACAEFFEYTLEEIKAAGGGLVLYADKDIAREVFDTIMDGKSWSGEVELISKSGRKFPVIVRADAIKDENGKIIGLIGVHTDITEHKETEKALRESESRYRELFENMGSGVAVYEVLNNGEDFIFKEYNAAAEELDKTPRGQVIGRSVVDVFPGVKEFGLLDVFRRVYRTGKSVRHPVTFYKDEKISGWRDNYVYKLPSGEVVAVYDDVTERKQTEEALRSEHIMLARTEAIAHVGSWEWDFTTDTVTWSDELFRIFQRDPREGAPSFAEHPTLYPADDIERLQQAVAAAIAKGTPYELELRAIRKDGETRVCIARGVAKMESDGRVVRLFGSLQDITERKQAEDGLKNSEAKYRNIFENAVEGIYQSTLEGRFLTVNAAFARMAGYDSPEELIKSFKDIGTQLYIHPEDRKRLMEIIEAKGFVEGYEVEFCKKDGSTFWVVINARTVKDEQGNILYFEGLMEDITIRKNAEEQLHQTLDRLTKAVTTTIQVLVSAVESRDPYTAGHQLRVADLARTIATEMGLPPDKIEGIRMAGSIHDIGKLSIPAKILSKPTKLTNIEFSLIKEHPKIGYEMLKNVESPWPLAQIVYQHHERMDGSGYPRNLKGDEIIIDARIMAVADVVEAMASHRPYRPGLGIDVALKEIEKDKGIFYDGVVADACLRLFREKGYQLK